MDILSNSVDTKLYPKADIKLFWTCWIALATSAFGFIIRAFLLPQWSQEFGLSNTQLGEISGVGLWPFAISIVIFSLIIDKIGYKRSLIFAFVCHFLSAFITVFAKGYWGLYIGTFIFSLGNGTVEAVANPVVASMFSKDKPKWLNRLHAAWAAGLVLGGILALLMTQGTRWEYKIALILIPTVIYGVMMIFRKFPVNERVKAGVSYKDMLKEVGAGGALIVSALIVFQLGSVLGFSTITCTVVTATIVISFGLYVKSFGQPLFIILLVLMVPLATTELGTDSWITDLMAPEMKKLGMEAVWILIYTSAIMVVLRFIAGSIIHRISPLGLLAFCSGIAAIGLTLMSFSAGMMILVAATIYGFGKAFFWPTILGVVAERFPKGGALTLNITGGVGMIGAGVVGAVILGFIQDKAIDNGLSSYDQANATSIHSTYVTQHKTSMFGSYEAFDFVKLASASPAEKAIIIEVQNKSKKEALSIIAMIPVGLMVSFLLLMLYFKMKGGYRSVELSDEYLGKTEFNRG